MPTLNPLDFRKTLSPNGERKILVNIMTWFGADGHTSGYRSDSPWIVKQQLSMWKDAGCDGVIATCGGIGKTIQMAAARLLCEKCEDLSMLFTLLLDHTILGAGKDEKGIVQQLNDSNFQDIFKSPAFIPEKYILDFDLVASMVANGASQLDANLAIVNLYKAIPGLLWLPRHIGFSWPESTNVIGNLINDNAKSTLVLPGVMLGFDDSGFIGTDGKLDKNLSVWGGGKQARIIDPMDGGLWYQMARAIQLRHKYCHIVTGNDLQERTALEALISVLTGRPLF